MIKPATDPTQLASTDYHKQLFPSVMLPEGGKNNIDL